MEHSLQQTLTRPHQKTHKRTKSHHNYILNGRHVYVRAVFLLHPVPNHGGLGLPPILDMNQSAR